MEDGYVQSLVKVVQDGLHTFWLKAREGNAPASDLVWRDHSLAVPMCRVHPAKAYEDDLARNCEYFACITSGYCDCGRHLAGAQGQDMDRPVLGSEDGGILLRTT